MVSSDLSRQGHHLSGSVSRTTYQQLLKIALEIGRWAEVIKFGYQATYEQSRLTFVPLGNMV